MGGTVRQDQPPGKAEGGRPRRSRIDNAEDGDIATPKRDRNDDDQPL